MRRSMEKAEAWSRGRGTGGRRSHGEEWEEEGERLRVREREREEGDPSQGESYRQRRGCRVLPLSDIEPQRLPEPYEQSNRSVS